MPSNSMPLTHTEALFFFFLFPCEEFRVSHPLLPLSVVKVFFFLSPLELASHMVEHPRGNSANMKSQLWQVGSEIEATLRGAPARELPRVLNINVKYAARFK